MPKSKIKTFSLQPKIIKLLCNCFNTENISEAVYKGLIGFLSNTFYGEHMDDFALHQLLTVEERTTIKKIFRPYYKGTGADDQHSNNN